MRAVDIIMKKRESQELTFDEIKFLINGYLSGSIPEYQISSFLMAVLFNGLTGTELDNLTEIMINSGEKLNFETVKGFKVDKHSTGGVGDKVSLIVAPIVAACCGVVPMMSGRGLGHTGGTLDKLESIPGYRVFLEKNEIDNILNKVGFVMMGQTEKIVPADKKLYSLRDVTATVESIPLISSSIMSKKIAEGTNGLVIDLKCGIGAFMKDIEQAIKLGNTLKVIGENAGLKMSVVITSMNEPLGYCIGNYLEVEESVELLKGNIKGDLLEVSRVIAVEMLKMTYPDKDDGFIGRMVDNAINDGSALSKFIENVRMQGGDTEYISDKKNLSEHKTEVYASESGFIQEIDAYNIGIVSMKTGAGRSSTDDIIDHGTGIRLYKKRGDFVEKGEALCCIYHREAADTDTGLAALTEECRSSFVIGQTEPEKVDIILKKI